VGLEDVQALLVHLDVRDLLVHKDSLELWDRWVQRESRQDEVSKDHRDPQAIQVCMRHQRGHQGAKGLYRSVSIAVRGQKE